MAGNPFRKAAPTQLPPPNIENDIKPAADSAPTERRASKTVKRVRIQTPPPLSPDTPAEDYPVWPTAEQFASQPTTTSIAPPPLEQSNERFVLPTPAMEKDVADVDPEVLENTRRNSGGDGVSAMRLANGAGSATPNPFAKTLAMGENKYKAPEQGQRSTSGSGVDWSAAEKGAAEKQKAAEKKQTQKAGLDVDSFTRLLLTGKAAGGATSDNSATSTAAAKPVSRAAPTAAVPAARPSAAVDSPDLSDLESASSSDSDEEYETPLSRKIEQAEVEKQSAPASIPPPTQPPPQPVRGPQTVAFSDWDSFDSALPATSTTSRPPIPIPAKSPPPPSKPAPPPSRRNRAHSGDSDLDPAKLAIPRPPRPRKTSSHIDPIDVSSTDTLPQIPRPPRPRAHSNLSIKSSTSSSMDTPTDSPPLPPVDLSPSRLRNDSTASNGSTTPSLTTSKPPPPPTRRAAPKPPHQDDTHNLDIPRRPTPTNIPPSSSRLSPTNAPRSASTTMAPPPPPKRRGSSKGSLDLPPPSSDSRRGSANRASQESGRPSLEAIRDEYDGEGTKRDMVADLEALQREVDALMKQVR